MLSNAFKSYTLEEAGQKYLILTPSEFDRAEIIAYQLEMLAENVKPCILPPEIKNVKGHIEFHYNITSLISLHDFLRQNVISTDRLMKTLISIHEVLAGSNILLLDDRNYLLEDHCIFLSTDIADVHMIYVPISCKSDSSNEFKELVLNMIARVRLREQETGEKLLRGIVEYIKGTGFPAPGFRSQLHKIWAASGLPYSKIPGITEENADKGTIGNTPPDKGNRKEHTDSPREVEPQDKILGLDTYIGNLKLKSILFIALLQIVVIIAAISAEFFMKKQQLDSTGRYGAILMFVIVCDLLIFKYLIKGRGSAGKSGSRAEKHPEKAHPEDSGEDMKRPLKKVSHMGLLPVQQGECSLQKTSEKMLAHASRRDSESRESMGGEPVGEKDKSIPAVLSAGGKDVNEDISISLAANDCKRDENILILPSGSSRGYDETTLLRKRPARYVALIREDLNNHGEFEILKEHLIIGRNADLSDMVIPEKTIGRVHAEMVRREDAYCLIDKHSRNGTAVNGDMLEPGMEYKLNDGDIIEFANVAYRFVNAVR